ncbi:MAG: divergent polysaccharide deacetylase family protein [Alphaproteobacteria bacterium]|nr:divergent polysaccharide deacetylase family protein [Alphaproteobacteria bacterium]
MSEFQAVLDEEMDKAVDEVDGEEELQAEKRERKKIQLNFSLSKFFSIPSFIKSFVFWALILLSIFIWTHFSADSTSDEFKSRLASKTVTIERNEGETYRVSEIYNPPIDVVSDESGGEETSSVSATPIKQNMAGTLTAAPVPGLYESLPEGIIPRARLEDGMTPFEAYKKPYSAQTRKPKIAFVAVDAGLSRTSTDRLIKEMPEEISLAFSPYAPGIKLLSDAARKEGHETWMMLPLENEDYPKHDPGPLTLLVTASIEQNHARLLSIMGRAAGYVGVISWEDHVYTPKDAETSAAIQQIFGRGLGVIDSSPSSMRDFGRRMAYSNEFPFAKNNFWLDKDLTPGAMRAQLKKLEDLAAARGEAIMLFHPYPKSIDTIQGWMKSRAAREYEVVPASFIAQYND